MVTIAHFAERFTGWSATEPGQRSCRLCTQVTAVLLLSPDDSQPLTQAWYVVGTQQIIVKYTSRPVTSDHTLLFLGLFP